MTAFSIRFLISNLYIALFILILYAVKRLMKKRLSARKQYRLWFFMLLLLPFPFLPSQSAVFSRTASAFDSWVSSLTSISAQNTAPGQSAISALNNTAVDLTADFSVSVSGHAGSLGFILPAIWLLGIGFMTLYFVSMKFRMHRMERSALPLQNPEAGKLYAECREELDIHRKIPVYSTAFIDSPFTTGILKPRIYLPIHLISNFRRSDMRYMFLHELQHYRHKDCLIHLFMNLSAIVYWFNPLIWFALRHMRADRELACDTSVLQMLKEDEYENYGMVLLNFAHRLSKRTFPFAAEMGGGRRHLRQRIINIASYRRSPKEKARGICAYALAAALLFTFAPFLPAHAADSGHAAVSPDKEKVTAADYSSYFGNHDGSFVLFDTASNEWTVYNRDLAGTRVSPDSTYKIYDALLGLESGIITPEDSLIEWDSNSYPFDSWMADQDLDSAMQNSVNWYFQSIDSRLDRPSIETYISRIGYGNEDLSAGPATYWLESSLKISPYEQTALLRDFYDNTFGFAAENIQAVKKAMLVSSGPDGSLYGKTGTGQVDGKEIRGWFVGFAELSGHTVFFASYVQDDTDASGSLASDITYSILRDRNLWNPEPENE